MKYLILISLFFVNGIIVCQEMPKDACYEQFDSISNRNIYQWVDSMPEFPGGLDSLRVFIMNNLEYPVICDYDVEGTVYISFFVETDGSISNKRVLRSIDEILDNEALKVVDKMPKWKPGKCKGIVVPARYIIPVKFRLY
jgi:periplasmic protein TonB